MSRKSKSTLTHELTAAESASLRQLRGIAAQVEDVWRFNGTNDDNLNRMGRRLPSEIDADIHISESQYCAMVVLLLWDGSGVEDDELLYLVASNRDWLYAARNAGFEVGEIAQYLSEKVGNHCSESIPAADTAKED